jgi:hypothetical protein
VYYKQANKGTKQMSDDLSLDVLAIDPPSTDTTDRDSTSHGTDQDVEVPQYFKDMAAAMNECEAIDPNLIVGVEFPFTVHYGFEATANGIASKRITVSSSDLDVILGGEKCTELVASVVTRLSILYGVVPRVIMCGTASSGAVYSSINSRYCITGSLSEHYTSDEDIMSGAEII